MTKKMRIKLGYGTISEEENAQKVNRCDSGCDGHASAKVEPVEFQREDRNE